MKRLIFLIFLIIVGVFFVKQYPKASSTQPQDDVPAKETQTGSTSEKSTARVDIESEAIFIPYWNVSGQIPSTYDKVIYFGVAGGKNGLIRDAGYQNVGSFNQMVTSDQETYLTLRLLDSDINLLMLEDKNLQQKIIAETVALAQANNFQGIIIDLELSVLPLDDVQTRISDFFGYANSEIDRNNLDTVVVIYGDAFYRARPFDIKFIGENSDEVMIMAYDFSKSYGEPGPNFPLAGKETYGYDFQTMVSDYIKNVPAEKLTVIFGMYGWNWPIGPQGKPLTRATAMSLNDIAASYLNGCSFTDCRIQQDKQAAETKISYTNEAGEKHVVWFENDESVNEKKNFLQENGIGKIGFWVWGYF